ncbi:hypothetical protein D3C73_1660880 [compost metagenome]
MEIFRQPEQGADVVFSFFHNGSKPVRTVADAEDRQAHFRDFFDRRFNLCENDFRQCAGATGEVQGVT